MRRLWRWAFKAIRSRMYIWLRFLCGASLYDSDADYKFCKIVLRLLEKGQNSIIDFVDKKGSFLFAFC